MCSNMSAEWFDERKEANIIAAKCNYDAIYDAAISAFKKLRALPVSTGGQPATASHSAPKGERTSPAPDIGMVIAEKAAGEIMRYYFGRKGKFNFTAVAQIIHSIVQPPANEPRLSC